MQQQGMLMKKAPASGPVEGFQAAGPSPAPASVTAGPSQAPASVTAGPSQAPTACVEQITYNPQGKPVYTCDGKVVDKRGQSPPMPKWLSSITARDGVDADEAAILNYWMSVDKREDMPGWVQQLASAEKLTESEKKALGAFTKDNVKPSQQIVKPSAGASKTGSTGTSTTGTKCKPACKPKPKCSTSSGTSGGSTSDNGTELAKPPAAKCKGPVDLGDYIRKDSIPCWACTL